jgi:hypothetical protein
MSSWMMLPVALALFASGAAGISSSQRSISTWIGWETTNLTQNYAAVLPYLDRISSLSLALPVRS